MANRNRDAGRERFWRSTLTRQAASGLSVRAFCRQEELAESAFYAWRRTIAQRDREQEGAQKRHHTTAQRHHTTAHGDARPQRSAKGSTRPTAKRSARPGAQRSAKQSARRSAKGSITESVKQSGKTSARRNGRATRAAAFVPVVVTGERPQPSDGGTGREEIVIELAGGRRLLLPEAITAERLARLVHALEADLAATGPEIHGFRAGAER